ncbi:hypothetical protein [Desulfobacter curvatus]|uniref:hypothetical protein n=1 Tax=Desulfobacter curvatus TaxID=2290 RepID=UPI0003730038|nr:hypothetical protein [Desulfobacter curvatus]
MKKQQSFNKSKEQLLEIKSLGTQAETNLRNHSSQMRSATATALDYLSRKGAIIPNNGFITNKTT